ncbi:MAG TPA: hypothetical protein VNG12_20020 [Acidimicrobiales bacterium]|nr:hypothetical protein [Acidimicrobiales bacterium]
MTRAAAAAVAVVVCACGLLLQPPWASATGTLSSIILVEPLPGLVAAPPGGYNGPITQSNLSLVTANDMVASHFAQDLTTGDVTGYLRLWQRQPNNGDGVVISAFQFQTSDAAWAFAGGFSGSLQGRASAAPFAVPGLDAAAGYEVHTSVAGVPRTEFLVSFVRGNTAVQVIVATQAGDLTAANAVGIATRQAALVPDTSTGSPVKWQYKAGEITSVVLFGILVFGLIVIFVQRRRERRRARYRSAMHTVAGPSLSVISYPPLPANSQEEGWTFIGDGRQVQWFWDGRSWTGRKMLTPAGWVER